jgi:outer membrane protein
MCAYRRKEKKMRLILSILIIVLFFSWTHSVCAQDLRLAYVNLKKVLDDYEKVRDGEKQLLKEAEDKNAVREKLVNEIKNLREKIDLLDNKEKEKKQKELDEKVKRLQDFTYETRTDLRQKRDEKFRDIMKEVKTVVEEYGKSHNYNIIIDDTLLLYKDDKLDATEDIIKTLNQRYNK